MKKEELDEFEKEFRAKGKPFVLKRKGKRMKNFTVKIDEELLLDFRLKCLKNRVSQVSIIRNCIQDYISKLDEIEELDEQLQDILKILDEMDLES